jgi:tRNA(Ile2) C34 agmatinyltransferase TiaS
MQTSLLLQALPILVGGGGLLSLFIARKERRAAANLNNTNAVDIMQKVYQQFVKDTAVEINMLKEEIIRLRNVVENYKSVCSGCPNNKNSPQ